MDNKNCYIVYSCDKWKSNSSMKVQYIVQNQDDLFGALLLLNQHEGITLNDQDDMDKFQNQIQEYQNKVSRENNGILELFDLNSRMEYCVIESCVIGL